MASRNPALSDQVFQRETQQSGGSFSPAWGSPADELPPGIFNEGRQGASTLPPPPGQGPIGGPPGTGGPITATGDTMRLNGTLTASAILLGIVIVAAVFGWRSVTFVTETELIDGQFEPVQRANFPGWAIIAMLGALGVGILTAFKPRFAVVTGPIYAVLMGLVAGAMSAVFNAEYEGIVGQALALTAGVFVMMLFLYATRIIRVTEKLRMGIVAATGAIALVYLVSLGLRLIFDVQVPFLHDSSPLGILISLVIVGVAAFNLLLDFDFIERGVQMGAPKHMEWYGAFGLMVSLIWLYLEILRLLAKMRER